MVAGEGLVRNNFTDYFLLYVIGVNDCQLSGHWLFITSQENRPYLYMYASIQSLPGVYQTSKFVLDAGRSVPKSGRLTLRYRGVPAHR